MAKLMLQMMISIPLALALALALSAVAQVRAQVLLQGFNWGAAKSSQKPWYNVIAGMADDAAEAGVTDVWFPPVSQSAAAEGYMPGQLYNLDASSYGTGAELRSAIATLKAKGIRAVADIVINHRTGSKQDAQGRWCLFEGGTEDDKLDWGAWAVVSDDKQYDCGTGNPDTGDPFDGAPDIDHTNLSIRKGLIDWMNWLKSDVGFSGWRFDFVKGYYPEAVAAYIDATSPAFAVGEYWDGDAAKVVNWIHSVGDKCRGFDFPTKGILQDAINKNDFSSLASNGGPVGVIGSVPSLAVTFVDNHDTAAPQAISPFPTNRLDWGYAYIFTHPGVPSIFYDHMAQSGLKNTITTLSRIRTRNGLSPTSSLRVIVAQQGLYMAIADNKVIVKIGPNLDLGSNTPSSDFVVAISGDGWAVWEKKTQ